MPGSVLNKAGDMVVTMTAPNPALRGSRTVHQSADQCQSWEGLAQVEGLGPGWIPHFWLEILGLQSLSKPFCWALETQQRPRLFLPSDVSKSVTCVGTSCLV